MAKANNTTKTATNATEDALILHCIAYAQSIASIHGTFAADPTDSEYAERLSARFERASKRALTEAAAIPATTFVGLNAKARIVPMVLRNEDCNYASGEARDFYRSFAADVKAFTDKMANDARAAAHAANQSTRKAA